MSTDKQSILSAPSPALAFGIAAGGAQAESDVRISGGREDTEIAYSGLQGNVAGGGMAAWIGGGGDESAFSRTGDRPGQGDRSAVYGNGLGGGAEVTYPGRVARAGLSPSIGAPVS